jgi:UPF0755 protein
MKFRWGARFLTIRPLSIGPLAISLLAMVLAAVALLSAWRWVDQAVRAPGWRDQAIVVVIPRGESLRATADRLALAGVLRHPNLFIAMLRWRGDARQLRAGEYAVPARASLADILALVTSGRVVQHAFTVAEGLTSAQVVALLTRAPALSGTIAAIPPDGSLLPETYAYVRGERREALLARMRRAMDKAVAALWAGRSPGLPYADPGEAVTLASIVEKETGVAEERRHIAGVFINRLKNHIPLQSDPTVIYALSGGAPLGRPLTRADLKIDSPYNTYRYHGLPPGPIANPGRAALAAALNPLATDDLYFVADGTGGHAFARSLPEHRRNVRRWRAERRRAAE